MTLSEYQALASRTINKALTPAQVLNHSLYEIASEVGEIHGIFQKELQGHPIDKDDLEKEIGDVLWGIAELCTEQGFDLEAVAEKNIEKLKARYPEGFDPERSLHREGEAK
jgi:NTP pyrophosphatase (non-canonical NTP hydrolase)